MIFVDKTKVEHCKHWSVKSVRVGELKAVSFEIRACVSVYKLFMKVFQKTKNRIYLRGWNILKYGLNEGQGL